MLKRFSAALLILFGCVVWVCAQDPGLPALPPLPGQDATTGAPALPPLPGADASTPSNDATAMPALPALPGSDNNVAAAPAMDDKEQKKEAKKKAKELEKLNKSRKKQGLEPLTDLPKENATGAAPVPATTTAAPAPAGTDQAASTTALPALPGETAVATDKSASTTALPALPGETTAAPVAEAAGNSSTAKVKKAKASIKKWHAPDFGPNVIFGGVVRTQGGTVEERLAWVSQYVLNGMDFHGYEFQKEEGAYAGQLVDKEWRQFTFQSRKKGVAPPVVIYVEPAQGNSVWLRVGPSEPPAGVPAKEVRKIRLQNQQVLKIMQKQLKGALRPVRGRWEAPYHRTNG